MFKLGNLKIPYPFFQSPLSGYSDYAMRMVSRKHGCPLTFAGVMLAKSAANPKVLKKKEFRPYDDEYPVGAQILGRNPKIMAKAANDLETAGYDIIDLNFACPAPKVLRRKRGGSLLDEPEKVIEIYRRVRDVIKCPLTVKLRAGVNNSEKSREYFWQIVESFSKENIDMITIHGRTVSKLYRGTADRDILGEVKKKYPSMIIAGSGDIFNGKDAKDLIENYGLDAIAVARGAIGNPWVYKEMQAWFDGNQKPAKPDIVEVGRVMLRQFDLVCTLFDKKRSVPYFRKFLAGYCKYHPNRKNVLLKLMAIKNVEKFKKCIEKLFIENEF